jgi:hypothetical protein
MEYFVKTLSAAWALAKYTLMITEDQIMVDKVRYVLNAELIKRSLTKYFVNKGFEDFKTLVYSPMIQDLPKAIPELAHKVEVIPFVKEVLPATGQVTIGWNLFVLGVNRMELGDSTHANMGDLQRAIYGPAPQSLARNMKSPKDIVQFIVKVMKSSQDGMIQPSPAGYVSGPDNTNVNRPKLGSTESGGYYEKNKPAG